MNQDLLNKMQNWCAYQERSQYDVRKKLYTLKAEKSEVEIIISQLISENFLNEERFAIAFAGGKFRIKKWGLTKIKTELKKHQVSERCINKALKALNQEDYQTTLSKLIDKKIKSSKQKDKRKIFGSVFNFMLSKGYEQNLVMKELNKQLHEDFFVEN